MVTRQRHAHLSLGGTPLKLQLVNPSGALEAESAKSVSCSIAANTFAFSYTHRPHLGPGHGPTGSAAPKSFPTNSFVRGFRKSDSQPYKPSPVLHIFFVLGQERVESSAGESARAAASACRCAHPSPNHQAGSCYGAPAAPQARRVLAAQGT